MKDELARLFHTPDPLTGNERTSDYWVQLPGFWIRMIHTSRTDVVSPDFTPSPIQGDLGDCLMADRYTYIIWSQFEDQIGTEIEDYWCSVVTTDWIEKKPEEDPDRSLFMAWQGFVVFATQHLQNEKIEQDTIDTSARPAKGLKTPGEPSLAERRLHELTHWPYMDWCPLCVKAKGDMVLPPSRLIGNPSFRLTTASILLTRTSHGRRFCQHVMCSPKQRRE